MSTRKPNKAEQQFINKLALEVDLPPETILEVYRSFWLFVKTKIEEFDTSRPYSKEEFDSLKTSFSIPFLGKFYISYKKLCEKHHIKYKKEEQKC